MIQLYLITGFLGAGKTTFLKNMIGLFPGKKLKVIVNEFGKEGVDGELLNNAGVQVDEINNGSIFCSCRLDKFEEVLLKTVQEVPDVILVEASGLSDPTNIEKILRQSDKFSSLEYKGSICLVDAVNFVKVFETARVCKMQLAVSNIVLINKTDLASEEQIEQLEQLITRQAPRAAIHQTSFGKVLPEWLQAEIQPAKQEGGAAYHLKDVGLQKRMIVLKDTMSYYQLEKFLKMFVEDTYRVKGFVCLEGKMSLVDCVGPSIAITPYEQNAKRCNHLIALAGPGMPLQKSIDRAFEWYRPYLERVE